jgi:subtilisin-like proprotein convertase family protein
MKTKLHHVFSIAMLLTCFFSFSQNRYWTKSTFNENTESVSLRNLDSKNYSVVNLNTQVLQNNLQGAPLRSTSHGKSNTIVNFPNEKGEMIPFRIVETQTLSEDIATLYPNIKTYLGFSTDGTSARLRFSITPLGLKALISVPDKEMYFIQPITKVPNGQYIVYNRSAKIGAPEVFECLTEDRYIPINIKDSFINRDANDQLLRTYRIAISATSEYTNFWDDGDDTNGTDQEDALAQVVSTLDRMNEVFEVDMAITFTLINGTELIYSGTDPYGGNLNGDLQTNLTATVGEANYDIGHLVHFAGNNGNAGCIGCVCQDGAKGSGFSAHSFVDNDGGPYMADFFDIDYVPHEVGHQMGANHTFAFNTEGTGVNSEPGSGTTIMGYAGITGGNDVQDHSDAYFHYHSINQILNNVATAPNDCAVTSSITNSPPIADAGSNYTIPNGTAFILKGAASDGDSDDVLTYTWEQIDSGATTNGNFGPTHLGPVWRSRPPSTSPDRYMPIFSRVLAGQLTETNPTETVEITSWETVSTVGRNLNFALTVKDRSEADGVGQMPQSSFDTMTVSVDGGIGPFEVTSQTTDETWDAGSTQTVTWDVAGSDGGAVNTPTVNILLSVDGGLTFPFTMASDVPNDGSHDVNVPVTGGDSNMARVIVEGNNNIFYAVNSTNFSIQESEFVISVANTTLDVCSPNDVVFDCTYNTFLGFTGTTDFSVTGVPAGATATISPISASADGTAFTVTISGIGSLTIGNYPITIVGTSGAIVKSLDVSFNVYDTNFASINLITPADGATEVVGSNAMFSWDADPNATNYELEIATDAGFATIVDTQVLDTNTYASTTLMAQTIYWWRVRAINDCGQGTYATASFETANLICESFNSADTPLAIPDNAPDGATSIINVPSPSAITDVNVTVNITHTWDADLTISLISPSGTSVVLSALNGGNGDNYTATVFDDDAANPIASGAAPFTGDFQPTDALSIFNGEFSAGDWTLLVVDSAGFDTGNIESWSLEICGAPQTDTDGDGIPDVEDNCVNDSNFDQADADGDGIGDVCDDDIDNDGILNVADNCPFVANPGQEDADGNGTGDACEVNCTTASATDVPINIAATGANANYTSIITVVDDLPITDVNVTIDIDHTWNNDLDIFLISPAGTSIELSTDNGAAGDDDYTNTVFDQEATTSITDGTSPFTGTFIPEGDLSDLYGEMSGGDWTLSVDDDFGAEDGGTILNFTIEFCVLGTLSVEDFDNTLSFMVYPNPNNGEFTIQLSNNNDLNISVFDIRGRKVFNNLYQGSPSFNETINLGDIQSGMYLLTVSDGLRTQTKKIIIN